MSIVNRFISANRSAAWKIRQKLAYAYSLQEIYRDVVGSHVRQGQVIIDVGAGKSCPFKSFTDDSQTLIGMDIAPEEIALNRDIQVRLVCDVCDSIPIQDAAADMIVSRSVVEHLPNVRRFAEESFRVLRPGGMFIHTMPSRFAPFAVLNQLIPNRISKKLLATFQEENKGICGFPAVYDHCWASSMKKLLQERGFEIEEIKVGYFQSDYFSFFLPAYLLSVGYELALNALDLKDLAASMLVVARKPGQNT